MTENLADFLADFGVDCAQGAVTFRALLDQPDDLLTVAPGDIQSRQYVLRYETNAVVLAVGSALTVTGQGFNNQAFKVRRHPMQLFDGAFSRVEVTKV